MKIYLLGIEESSLRGLKTRKPLRALTSKPSICNWATTAENKLNKYKIPCSYVYLSYDFIGQQVITFINTFF